MIIAEVSIVPLGEGTSTGKYVKVAVDTLKKANVNVIPGPMCTAIEANNLETIFAAVRKAHEAVLNLGARRVLTTLKIDDRKDKEVTASYKMKAIQ